MVEVVKYGATGRRKKSVSHVIVSPGTGRFNVNGKTIEQYFPREVDRSVILAPLTMTNTLGKFDAEAKITGGGTTGQAGALQLSLARVLSAIDPENKNILKKATLLRRDPRMKERKKPGQKGARKKFQWVKR
ncbi:MAG: 30S ribosomal protein S9 [Candidatus Omnitrophica bacterium]|nr:30S ribosomal protein S9 [Candidatus Omnitrophota bacterium]